jgi:hypothetical protein
VCSVKFSMQDLEHIDIVQGSGIGFELVLPFLAS